MGSLQDLEKTAQKKGISAVHSQRRESGADNVVGNYIVAHSPEGTLKRSIESLDGFCSFWEEQSITRHELKNPEAYLNQVNTIYSSYRNIRKNLDGTIAYLIGDWLLECRSRFFPDTDRKTRGQWFSFLRSNLCDGFEKTTAYEFMSIAEKLKEYRREKLPLHMLKALLRAKNGGVEIQNLDVNHVSSKDVLSLLSSSKEKSSSELTQGEVKKLVLTLEAFLMVSDEIDYNSINEKDSKKILLLLNQVSTKFHSAPRNEISSSMEV